MLNNLNDDLQKKAITFAQEERAPLPRQCRCVFMGVCYGETEWIALPTAGSSSSFSRSASKWLLVHFPDLEDIAHRKEIWRQRWNCHLGNRLFCNPRQILLFGKGQEIGETLVEIYGAWQSIRWEINKIIMSSLLDLRLKNVNCVHSMLETPNLGKTRICATW